MFWVSPCQGENRGWQRQAESSELADGVEAYRTDHRQAALAAATHHKSCMQDTLRATLTGVVKNAAYVGHDTTAIRFCQPLAVPWVGDIMPRDNSVAQESAYGQDIEVPRLGRVAWFAGFLCVTRRSTRTAGSLWAARCGPTRMSRPSSKSFKPGRSMASTAWSCRRVWIVSIDSRRSIWSDSPS